MQNHSIDSLLLGSPLPDPSSSTIPGSSNFVTELLLQCQLCTKAAMELPQGPDYDMYHNDPTALSVQNAFSEARLSVWKSISRLGAVASHDITEHALVNTLRHEEKYALVKQCIGDSLESANKNIHLVNKYKANDYNMSTHHNTNQLSQSFSTAVEKGISKKMLKRMLERNDDRSVGNAPTKPQILHQHKVDNSFTPFRPVLRHKPNAIVPLNESILRGLLPVEQQYPHPYKEEIIGLEYCPDQVLPSDLYPVHPLDKVPCYWIDTIEDLLQLEHGLKQQKVFAIDLEHHSQHTYQGVTCLLQISTPTQDFIIDALVLREKLSILNSSFTNPRIVKVLHGCTMDVLWLQRDLGLYLVNIFDTSQAARVLEFPRHGLASLLDHYCNIKADKQYQLSDWRSRPLNREMLVYAREDTHYLLYIYSRMKNELIDRSNLLLKKLGNNVANIYSQDLSLKIANIGTVPGSNNITSQIPQKVPFLLSMVLIQSNKIPLTQYEKQNRPVLTARKLFSRLRIFENNIPTSSLSSNMASSSNNNPPVSSLSFSTDHGHHQNNGENTTLLDDHTNLRLFCAIFAWRDQKARELDESPGIVLKLDNIIRIVQTPPGSVLELEQLIRPISIFLRPLLVPLFHLIQGVLQLPSELYNLNINKMKFAIDGLKDLAEYQTTLGPNGGTNNENFAYDGLELNSLSTLTADDIHMTSLTPPIDPSIGFSHNDKIQRGRKMLPGQDGGNNAPKETISNKKTNRKDKNVQNAQNTLVSSSNTNDSSTTLMTDDPAANSDGNDRYWGDDTIAQLQHQITIKYNKMRYAHPLYFLPDYIHSIIDRDWGTSGDSITDNITEDVAKLASDSGWGKSLPDFPSQRDKLSRLNWHAAKKVLEFSHTLQQNGAVGNAGVPTTKHGLKLFDVEAIGENDQNTAKSDKNKENGQEKNKTDANASPLIQLNTSPDNTTETSPNESGLVINPITSERLQQHNTNVTKNLIENNFNFNQCNQHFTTPLKPIATNSKSTNANSAFSLLQQQEQAQNGTHKTENKEISSKAIKSKTSTSAYNPVASLNSFDEEGGDNDVFASMISPPRKLGTSTQNPLFTPAHARIGGKLSTAMITNPSQSLDWDGDVGADIVSGTPHTAKASGLPRSTLNNKKIEKFSLGEKGTKMGDGGNTDSEDDNDNADSDEERIPDITNKGIGSVPTHLHDIYKISNLKRLMRDGTNTNDTNNKDDGVKKENEGNNVVNPFAPSQMLLEKKNFQAVLNIKESSLFVDNNFGLSKDGINSSTKESHSTAMSDGAAGAGADDAKNGGKKGNSTKVAKASGAANTNANTTKSAAPVSSNPFVVNTTNNPFMATDKKDLNEMGTIYNAKKEKENKKGDKNNTANNQPKEDDKNANNRKRRFY